MNAKQIEQQERMLRRFVETYCRHKHDAGGLCPACSELLDYALQRLARCPMDPKPKCKDCPVHCYAPEQRRRIQEVMRFSGIHFVKRGRLDWLLKYFIAGR